MLHEPSLSAPATRRDALLLVEMVAAAMIRGTGRISPMLEPLAIDQFALVMIDSNFRPGGGTSWTPSPRSANTFPATHNATAGTGAAAVAIAPTSEPTGW
jgi:hypothetical protein